MSLEIYVHLLMRLISRSSSGAIIGGTTGTVVVDVDCAARTHARAKDRCCELITKYTKYRCWYVSCVYVRMIIISQHLLTHWLRLK